MSFSHRSTAARAFVRPRGQRPSTSTRTPSASDAGSYTRLTWIDETIRVSSSESTILRAARREKLKAGAWRYGGHAPARFNVGSAVDSRQRASSRRGRRRGRRRSSCRRRQTTGCCAPDLPRRRTPVRRRGGPSGRQRRDTASSSTRIIIAVLLESFLADIRFALRWLRKSPGFTMVAVASLAIGIGVNTALFTIVDALLFKPLPVAAADRLVDLFTSDSTGTVQFSTSSYPDYLDLQARNDVFEGIVGYSPMMAPLNLDNRSRLAMGEIVTGNYFQVLGVPAAVGRTILPEDDRPAADRVVMVSHRYWTRELASAPDVLGRLVRIRGVAYAIVGVAPAAFNGMVPVLSPELWMPVSASLDVEPVGMHDAVPSPSGTTRLDRRADRWLFMRARLKPGRLIEDARANLTVLMSQIEAANPVTNKGRRLSFKATRDVHFHPAADPIVVPIAAGLMIVVGLVLLIACANVASMLLARASARQREIGIRLAIGASRGRLIRQLVTEAILISLLGAIAGTLLAWWMTSLAAALSLPLPIPLAVDLRIDARVLAFTLAATCLAGLLAGVAPGVHASKPNLVADLRGDTQGSRASGWRWTLRDALVTGQMAVTALLLVVAALLTRSLIAAERTNVGFAVNRLAIVSTDTAMLRYPEARGRQFYDQALAK